MPRPKGQTKAVLSTKVPPEHQTAFKALAAEKGTNAATLLAQLVAEAVDGKTAPAVAPQKETLLGVVEPLTDQTGIFTQGDVAAGKLVIPQEMSHLITQDALDGIAEKTGVPAPEVVVDPGYEVVGGKGTGHKHTKGGEPVEERTKEDGTRQVRYLCTECGATLPWQRAKAAA